MQQHSKQLMLMYLSVLQAVVDFHVENVAQQKSRWRLNYSI